MKKQTKEAIFQIISGLALTTGMTLSIVHRYSSILL